MIKNRFVQFILLSCAFLATPLFAKGVGERNSKDTASTEVAITGEDTLPADAISEETFVDETTGYAVKPGFDCGAELTAVEATICGNGDLSGLDADLNALYQEWKKSSEDASLIFHTEAFKTVEADQLRWLQIRNACSPETVACIMDSYVARESQIRNPVVINTDEMIEIDGKNEGYRTINFVQPHSVDTFRIPLKMLASPLRSVQSEVLRVIDIYESSDMCMADSYCNDETYFIYIEMSPELAAVRQDDVSADNGPDGISLWRTWWVDTKNDRKLNFSELFDPEDFGSLQNLLASSVLAEVKKIQANAGEDIAWEELDTAIFEWSLMTWDLVDIYPIISEDGKVHSFGVSGDDFEFGPGAATTQFRKMEIPAEPFLELMKPEFRSIFEK